MSIGKRFFLSGFILCLTVIFPAVPEVSSTIYPHYFQNEIDCTSCHDVWSSEPKLMPPWTSEQLPQDIDDTQFNKLCWSCHNELDGSAPFVKTHSSRQADSSYGHWTVQCVVCHDPHYQRQAMLYTGSSDYMYVGKSDSVTATTIYQEGAGWDEDEFAGMVVLPNKFQIYTCYKIIGNSSDTLYVDPNVATEGVDGESMDLTRVSDGDTFAISYGQLVRSPIDLGRIMEYAEDDPFSTLSYPKSGLKAVKFVNPEGDNSFADGDSTFNGVCEICHTQTNYHQNDGSADQDHNPRTNCTRCHSHENGFMHGGGGAGCYECHGHDPGYNDPVYGIVTGGRGTYRSHSTHTEDDADDLKGPNLLCSDCHDTDNFPMFKDGETFATTTVCNPCHSPGGDYDGIDGPELGAKYGNSGELKYNWRNSIYDHENGNPFTLKPGKEKWCATCHDGNPSVISGVTAPNVIGDEDGSFTYGSGWGFYKTGHGLDAASSYPASADTSYGAGKGCADCHDFSLSHIDGSQRSFDCSDGCDSDEYRQGYRLRTVNGRNPMELPLAYVTPPQADNYRLCFASNGCHLPARYLSDTRAELETLFRDDRNELPRPPGTSTYTDDEPLNAHMYHLDAVTGMNGKFSADWGSTKNSTVSCISCHNVHGSTQLAMVRDGKLINNPDGMEVLYTDDPDVNIPKPEPKTLDASQGTWWNSNTSDKLCQDCHGGGGTVYHRDGLPAVQQAPILDWTGESPEYTADGVNPESGADGSIFHFRVKYTDVNHDMPLSIQVWVDLDDSDSYEENEKFDLWEVDFDDTDTADGKLYRRLLEVGHPGVGDGILNYRFYAADRNAAAEANDPVTAGGTLTVTATANNAPVLAWTGETGYESDGVDPDAALATGPFVFHVEYRDNDGTAPSVQEVWIDLNDDLVFADPGEKFTMAYDPAAPNDGDYTNGEIFTFSQDVPYPAGSLDGKLMYTFYFSDGTDDAAGEPASPHFLRVADPACDFNVSTDCSSLSNCYSDDSGTPGAIQQAVNASATGNRICVYGGTWKPFAFNAGKDNIVQSVSGPDLTIIDGGGSGNVVAYNDNSNSTLKGFTVRNGNRGISSNKSNATIVDCMVQENGSYGVYFSEAGVDGNSKELIIAESVIRSNASNAIYIVNNESHVTVTGTEISGNTAASGPAFRPAGGINSFKECIISNNRATSGDGGAVRTVAGTYTFENCIFSGNYASGNGGGVFATNSGSVTMTNCTFAGNSAELGGGIYSDIYTDSLMKVRNSILWGNEARASDEDQIDGIRLESRPIGVHHAEVQYTDIGLDQRYSEFTNQVGNMYMDPRFVDPVPGASAPSALGDYHLQATSPLIDQVVNDYGLTIDVDGEVRPNPVGGVNDTGADEYYYNPGLDLNETYAHTVEAVAEGGSAISISMPYGMDANADNSYTVEYNCDTTTGGVLLEWGANPKAHTVSPYTDTITGLTPGETCSVTMTYMDPDGVTGVNPQTVSFIVIPFNETTTEAATAVPGVGGDIAVSMPYTGDDNENNTYMVQYKHSSMEDDPENWTLWASGPDHVPTPYTTTISGLVTGTYDVRMTYFDGDGVIGTNPQTVTGVAVANNATTARTATAVFAGGTSINVTMSYTNDDNDSNTFTVSYSCTTSSGGPLPGNNTHPDPYSTTISGLIAGETCSVTMTYIDGDGVIGDNPQTVSGIIISEDATLAGTGTAIAAGDYSIDVAMPYTFDANDSNTFTVDYELSSSPGWTNWTTGDDTAYPGPYTTTITGLTAGETYNVRMTYIDADGVNGESVQTVSDIALTHYSTTSGTATATAVGETSIDIFMPYTGDADEDNTFTVSYDCSVTGAADWVNDADNPDRPDPYTTTITGLTAGEACDVTMTYTDDTDGVNGTATQVVSVAMPDYATTTGTATAAAGLDNQSIVVTMPYTFDDNSNNTFTADYDCTSTGPQNWVTDADNPDRPGPYSTTITGLSQGDICDVTMTYNDADGVSGVNPQTVNLELPGGAASDKTVRCTPTLADPPDYDNIQDAIDAVAADGEIIEVCADTYSENIDFNGWDITVRSASGAATTSIIGNGSNAPVVTFSGGETVNAVLEGFTIDNQRDDFAAVDTQYARGIYISNGSAPKILDCVIAGNKNEVWNTGAGIFVNGNNGGGVTIVDSDIGVSGNPNQCNYGAGLYATATTSPGEIVISNNSTVAYNLASQWGAGLYISGMDLTLLDSLVSNNNSQSGNDNYSGGGMLLLVPDSQSMTVTITGCTIDSNKALNATETGGGKGGGIAASTGATNSFMTLNIEGSRLRGNHSWLDGGGLYLDSGGVTATITNSIITGNAVKAGWEFGGGISNYAAVNIYNTTIAGNYAGSQGGGLHAGGSETVRNSIVWGNSSGSSNPNISGGADTVAFSDIEGGYTGTGNISDDPLFAIFDPEGKASSGAPAADGDVHLTAGSKCIDTASAIDAPSVDIDGTGRPIDITPNLGGEDDGVNDFDMGAYEYSP